MNEKLKHFVFICLTISIVISPALTHSAGKDVIDNNITLNSSTKNSSTNKHKTPSSKQTTIPETNIHNRKATLNNDSRGLSGFFILGIIINIIMIITFSWWFSKEWRRQPK